MRELIATYRSSAEKHGEATRKGDYRKANKHHDILNDALVEIRKTGKIGAAALMDLLTDDDDSVRCWAATHCLVVEEPAARRVLQQFVDDGGFLAMDAEMVLKEWDKGTLKTP
ncbi:MAG: DUF2019 domain-containing protein [Deltaproteobacteria bacterium]|nr:DUF2019 domain-containing protein [Deltaproteobacteria bacterium]